MDTVSGVGLDGIPDDPQRTFLPIFPGLIGQNQITLPALDFGGMAEGADLVGMRDGQDAVPTTFGARSNGDRCRPSRFLQRLFSVEERSLHSSESQMAGQLGDGHAFIVTLGLQLLNGLLVGFRIKPAGDLGTDMDTRRHLAIAHGTDAPPAGRRPAEDAVYRADLIMGVTGADFAREDLRTEGVAIFHDQFAGHVFELLDLMCACKIGKMIPAFG